MINFMTPPPSWLPSLLTPADWLVARFLGILLLIGFAVSFGAHWINYRKGEPYV